MPLAPPRQQSGNPIATQRKEMKASSAQRPHQRRQAHRLKRIYRRAGGHGHGSPAYKWGTPRPKSVNHNKKWEHAAQTLPQAPSTTHTECAISSWGLPTRLHSGGEPTNSAWLGAAYHEPGGARRLGGGAVYVTYLHAQESRH